MFAALGRALATMDLRNRDEATRSATFSTGVSMTSWGEHMIATVRDAAGGGARITVRGRPKGSFLTTKSGEELHAKGVEKDLRVAVDDALAQPGPPTG